MEDENAIKENHSIETINNSICLQFLKVKQKIEKFISYQEKSVSESKANNIYRFNKTKKFKDKNSGIYATSTTQSKTSNTGLVEIFYKACLQVHLEFRV